MATWRSVLRISLVAFLVISITATLSAPASIVRASATGASFPRIGNYNGYTTGAQAPIFSRYNLAVAMDSMTWLHPTDLSALRQANPGVTLLGYERAAMIDYTALNRYGTNAIYPGWWLLNAGSTLSANIDGSQTSIPVASTAPFKVYDDVLVDGESMHITGIDSGDNTLTVIRGFYSTAASHSSGAHIATHAYLNQGGPSTPSNSDPFGNPSSDRPWTLNMSSVCPRNGAGQRWIDFLANWIVSNVLNSGYWDGIFIDNSNPKLYTPTIDVNNDNVPDEGVITTSIPYDNVWQDGLDSFFAELRGLAPSALILGTGPAFSNVTSINGQNFNIQTLMDPSTYQYLTTSYAYHMASSVSPPLSFINTSTATGPWDLQTMRLGLGTTLLNNGVYIYDRGPTQNGTPWWFDEYDNGAGTALNADATASDTQLHVVSSSLFQPGNALEVEEEMMSVTAVAPGLLTVTRGISGTVAATHSSGSVVATPQQIAQGIGYLGQPLGAAYPVGSSTTNLVTNGDFSTGSLSPWKLTVNAPAGGVMTLDPANGVDGSASAAITVTATDGHDLDVRAEQSHIALSGGATYTVSFWARSTLAHSAHLEVCSPSLPSSNQCIADVSSPVGPTWAQYSAQFTMPNSVSVTDAAVKIAVADALGTTWLTGVQLVQTPNPVMRRDFQNGAVLVNGTLAAWSVTLPPGYCHLRGDQNPSLNNGSAVTSLTIPAQDSVILRACSVSATPTSVPPPATRTVIAPTATSTFAAPTFPPATPTYPPTMTPAPVTTTTLRAGATAVPAIPTERPASHDDAAPLPVASPLATMEPVVPPVEPALPTPPATTPTPQQAPHSHTAVPPLAVSLAARRVQSGGTLTVQGHTMPRALVRADLRVTTTKTSASGADGRRAHAPWTVILYEVATRGRADAHGRITCRLHITYQPSRPVMALLTVTATQSRYTVAHTAKIAIQPRHHGS